MIDIHHHCLPSVDDGPRDLAEAIAMCRMALQDGIETIVATPHLLRGRWRPLTVAELQSQLDILRAELGGRPRLVLGAECYFSHDMTAMLESGQAIPLAGSRYVLMEFAADAVPPHLERPIYQLQLAGWVPVIAHPERNGVFASRPDLLASLVEFGARTQITAGSLLGQFGAEARRSAERWIGAGLVHFVATDAHNVRNRLPVLQKAVSRIQKIAGARTAEALTVLNPEAVLDDRPLPFVPSPELLPQPGFLTRFKSLLGGGR